MPEPRRVGRRQRRLAWAAGILATGALAAALVMWKIHRDSQPEEYVPGESSADITRSIEEKGAKRAAAGSGARTEYQDRRRDPLRDPGQKLPAGAPEPRFTDVTKEAGLDGFRAFAGKRSSQLPEDMGGGVAWGDYDNDGNEDLFLVSAGGAMDLPPEQRANSMLFRNLGNGKFEPDRSFPELRIPGMGAAWGDYNNDGWLDLVVTGFDTLLLFRNDHGRLVRDARLPSPRGFWAGVSWGDFNNDGWLDFYVCGYVRYVPDERKKGTSSPQFGLEVPYTLNPASFEPERNLLWKNNGNGTFTEIAKQMGVDNPEGRSLSALWHDFDGDGWLDLYVANDISENRFFLNQRGRFKNFGRTAWVEEYRGSMGLAAGDFDRDGDDDLFISHWVAQQFALFQSLLAENRGQDREAALRFTDVSEGVGIGPATLQKIGWGAAFADFDSDGWLDLAVANGSTFETKAGERRLAPMESFLFWNKSGFFYDLAPWNLALSAPHVSRGLAVADYNNDGAVDIAIVDLDGGVRLLRNDLPHGNWVELRLRDKRRGGGDGATVVASAGGKPLRAMVTSASYLSQDSRRVHFGLGAQTSVEKLEVAWLGGRKQTWTNLAANRIWELEEGDAAARPFAGGAPKLSREQLVEFWAKQRAAMDAMKREGDIPKAERLFGEALRLNPAHEDSHYYLANCQVAQGRRAEAMAQLEALTRINPLSHRGWQRRGVLLAVGAATLAEMQQAEESLDRALKINPEETGSLLLLAETALARHDLETARARLRLALQSNPRSVGGLFLNGYIAWKQNRAGEAAALLASAQKARGPDWKPKGSVAEGDVNRRMDAEAGFLAPFWEDWNGTADPAAAYARTERYLAGRVLR